MIYVCYAGYHNATNLISRFCGRRSSVRQKIEQICSSLTCQTLYSRVECPPEQFKTMKSS